MTRKILIVIFALLFVSCANAFNDAAGIDGSKNTSTTKNNTHDTHDTKGVSFYDVSYKTSSGSTNAIYHGSDVYMDISIHNESNKELKGVSVQLNAENKGITLVGSCATQSKRYGNIAANSYKSGYYTTYSYKDPNDLSYCTTQSLAPFHFKVDNNFTPQPIYFSLVFTDEDKHTWNDLIVLRVKSNEMLRIAAIKSGNNECSNDLTIKKTRDNIYFDIALYNASSRNMSNIMVTLSSDNSYINFSSVFNQVHYNGLPPYNYGIDSTNYAASLDSINWESGNNFAITLSYSCPANTIIPVTAQIKDVLGNNIYYEIFYIIVEQD